MGNSTKINKSKCFNELELEKIKKIYEANFATNSIKDNIEELLSNKISEISLAKFSEIHKIRILDYLKKVYQMEFKENLKTFDEKAYIILSEILLKSNNCEDAVLSNLYHNQSYIYILYDLIKSTPGAFRSEPLNDKIIFDILDFALNIFIELHDDSLKEDVKQRYNKNSTRNYLFQIFKYLNLLKNNPSNDLNNDDSINIEKRHFDNFLSEYMFGLDCLIRDNINSKIMQTNTNKLYYNNPLPTFQLGVSSILSTEEFFVFCLANPFLSNKKHAYKLYCCNEMGFNISSVIYSFLGFDGPICIFISNLNKDNSKSTIGIFLNSNYKECFENYVGDDCCFPFIISPYLNFYKIDPLSLNRNKILYLSSKNHKNTNMRPGIGLGYGYSGSKIWIDLNDPFKKSYFNKNESVYHEGSPFENDKEILNVLIE